MFLILREIYLVILALIPKTMSLVLKTYDSMQTKLLQMIPDGILSTSATATFHRFGLMLYTVTV
jgi:hypothetical protein